MLQTEKAIQAKAKVTTRIHNLYYITNIAYTCTIKLAKTGFVAIVWYTMTIRIDTLYYK